MQIVLSLIVALFYLLAPAGILFLCRKYNWINKLGAVVIAYILGLIVGNLRILPSNIEKMQDLFMTVTIPLAIPLLLFSADIKSWFRLAGKVFISLFIGILMVVAVVITGYFIFHTPDLPQMWKIAGMLVGVYTGGTPNLAAIAMMLDVDPNTYVITHSYDLFVGSLYLFFLLTAAQRFFNLFLPAYTFQNPENKITGTLNEGDAYAGIFSRPVFIPLLIALGVAVIIFLLAAIPAFWLKKENQMVVVVLIITTLGILASLVPRLKNTDKTFELGMYLILIFSLVVSSMADVRKFSIASLPILYYIAYVIFGSLILQSLISRIFRIDSDTMIITSTALICSPPFVPVVAGALKNREIILSGITVGIIGYAVGNYLGYLVGNFLSGF